MRIAIAGGGPAGATAARRLARGGAEVTLFDHSHPREKPCGGGLTGRALALVAGALDAASLPAVVVRSAVVESPASRGDAADVPLIDRGLHPGSTLVVVSRAAFDAALLNAAVNAGAGLRREQVLAISRRGAGFVLKTTHGEYEADFLIGADGANSLVRKTLLRPFARPELSIAAGYFVRDVTSRAIVVRTMREQPGYLWSFPRPDHLAVGVCAPAAGRSSSRALLEQSRAWIEAHYPRERLRLDPYAWPIPSAGFGAADHLEPSGPGWMLLGDAAGLVDPLTREGIYYALLSGCWAADALSASPGRAVSLYRERLRAELYPELRRAAKLCGLFFSPAFASLLVSALRESDSIRTVFAALVAGDQPYRGLRRRLLATREWKLAGRALRMALSGTISADLSNQYARAGNF